MSRSLTRGPRARLGGLACVLALGSGCVFGPKPAVDVRLGKASATFHAVVELDLPPDDGSPNGTLFEIRDAHGRLLAGAGFPWSNNTTQTSNPRTLSVYFRHRNPGYRLVDLGQPFGPAIPSHLVSVGDNLLAVAYNILSFAPRRFDRPSRRWIPTSTPLDKDLEKEMAGTLAVQAVNDVPLLLYMYSVLSNYHTVLLSYGGRMLRTPPELRDLNGNDMYYRDGRLYLFLGDRRSLHAKWAVCSWRPGDPALTNCRITDLPDGEFFYVIAPNPEGPGVLAVDTNGKVLVAGPGGEVQWQSGEVETGQVYSAVATGDGLLLGHYPTGSIAQLTSGEGGLGYALTGEPVPAQECSTQGLREAQSLGLWSGDLVVGVWPFGELWEGSPESGWRLLRRLFAGDPCGDAPHEDLLVDTDAPAANVLGQRIWGMANWRAGLAVSTSAKNYDDSHEYLRLLSETDRQAYGRVWLVERNGELACNIPGSGHMTLEVTIAGNLLTVRKAGIDDSGGAPRLCTTGIDPTELVSLRGSMTTGSGLWGPFRGSILSVDVH